MRYVSDVFCIAAAHLLTVSFAATASKLTPTKELVAAAMESWEDAAGRCPVAGTQSSGAEVWGTIHKVDAPESTPGCQGDSRPGGLLLPALRFLYENPASSGAFLDVGAHVGRWAAEVLTAFGRLEYKKYAKEFGKAGDKCPPPDGHTVVLYCFEPVKQNYERLHDRAKRSAWQLEGFNLVKAAVNNASGKVNIWSNSKEVDPGASMTFKEAVVVSEVKAVTLDLFIKKSVAQGRAFLARLAINGHEAKALAGLKKSLKQRTVRFVLFEVSPLWAVSGLSLSDAVKAMWKVEYLCFALLPNPVPLSGPFWKKTMASSGPAWFNVFCGAVDDLGLRRVIRTLDPDGHDWFQDHR